MQNLIKYTCTFFILLLFSVSSQAQILTTSGITEKIQTQLPFIPIYEWSKGMSFYLTENNLRDTKFRLIVGEELGDIPDWTDYAAEKVIFQGYRIFEEEKLCFVFEINGVNLAYDSGFKSLDEIILKRGFYTIPNLLYIENSAVLKSILQNVKFQVMVDFGYEYSGQTDWSYEYNSDGNATSVKNTVPYPIVFHELKYNIENTEFPVTLNYYHKNKLRSINIRASGINSPPFSKCKSGSRDICDLDEHLVTDVDYSNWVDAVTTQTLNRYAENERLSKLQYEEDQKLERSLKSMLWAQYKTLDCAYRKDLRDDDFEKKNIRITETYNLYEPNYEFSNLNIQLINSENSLFVRFYSKMDLGIENHVSSKGDFVYVALQNGDVIKFKAMFPAGSNAVGHNFFVLAKITANQVQRLKQSSVKSIKLDDNYTHVLDDIYWTSFFIDKLDCIE